MKLLTWIYKNSAKVVVIIALIIIFVAAFGLHGFYIHVMHGLRGEYGKNEMSYVIYECRSELILFSISCATLLCIKIEWKRNWKPLCSLVLIFVNTLLAWEIIYYHFISLIVSRLWSSLILSSKNEWYFPLAFILLVTLFILELAVWRKRKDMNDLFLTPSNHDIKPT